MADPEKPATTDNADAAIREETIGHAKACELGASELMRSNPRLAEKLREVARGMLDRAGIDRDEVFPPNEPSAGHAVILPWNKSFLPDAPVIGITDSSGISD